jgi:hypothetical protein
VDFAAAWRMLCRKSPAFVPTCGILAYNGADMTTRAGLEAEAITRLTENIEPRAVRAILVQCLVGELAPSTAISRMLEAGGAATVRLVIDDVTHRAATISRASDMLVHDRVDELTQVFVEMVAALTDATEPTTSRSKPEQAPLHPGSAGPGGA